LADLTAPFGRATMALTLLAIDPLGLGGLVLRARSGPVRDAYAEMFAMLPLPLVRLHPSVSDEALYGGLDLSATLSAGRIVQEQGLLTQPAVLVLTMAERCALQLGARLAAVLDEAGQQCLVALDEGIDADEGVPSALCERTAFRVDLDAVAQGDITGFPPEAEELAQARDRLRRVAVSSETLTKIAVLATQFGIDSARASVFAARAARAHAALLGKDRVDDDDLQVACALTLAHRATLNPAQDDAPQETEAPPDDAPETESTSDDTLVLPEELLLEAVRAMLPPDLLARLATGSAKRGKGHGSGAKTKGNRRGRPLPARSGRLGNGARIDLVATLRAAAPWQTIRKQADAGRTGLHIRPGDIRIKRFEDKSDRLLIFAVDASGSAALARLAEAKGAVELLLAQAYARRDHVALIAFRGTGAEILLPPTRSLVQTKRRLAGLPGGGGTPLAAGLRAAMELSDLARRRGLTPTVALLTDGRANVALDGTANRAQAAADALLLGRALRAARVDAVVIDTGNRPEPALRSLSDMLGGTYIALPRADADRLSRAVASAIKD
jgi:magnesium chelatase subunit D